MGTKTGFSGTVKMESVIKWGSGAMSIADMEQGHAEGLLEPGWTRKETCRTVAEEATGSRLEVGKISSQGWIPLKWANRISSMPWAKFTHWKDSFPLLLNLWSGQYRYKGDYANFKNKNYILTCLVKYQMLYVTEWEKMFLSGIPSEGYWLRLER